MAANLAARGNKASGNRRDAWRVDVSTLVVPPALEYVMSGSTINAVQFYWRPGCGFCARLDRARARRYPDGETQHLGGPGRRAIVRSLANGNETVPTIVIDDIGMVNPSADEVITVLSSRARTWFPRAESPQPSRLGKWPADSSVTDRRRKADGCAYSRKRPHSGHGCGPPGIQFAGTGILFSGGRMPDRRCHRRLPGRVVELVGASVLPLGEIAS